MPEKTLYTVSIFSENRVGLLNVISIIYTRRKLNIETLSVSGTSIEGVHKFTITNYTDKSTIEKLVKQVEKRIDVLKAFYYTDDELVFQEIALYKVPTKSLLENPDIERIVRKHNARILDISKEYTIFEKTGKNDETTSLFEELKEYDIVQFVRSGRVAITKSNREYVTEYIAEQEKRKEMMGITHSSTKF